MTAPLRTAVALSCALALLGGGAARAAAAPDTRPVRPLVAKTVLATERLSDEQRITRFANAVQRSPVHARPTKGSRAVGRLRFADRGRPARGLPRAREPA